ncbi:hypothetical protein ACJX0J_030153, partial [Zea mays]
MHFVLNIVSFQRRAHYYHGLVGIMFTCMLVRIVWFSIQYKIVHELLKYENSMDINTYYGYLFIWGVWPLINLFLGRRYSIGVGVNCHWIYISDLSFRRHKLKIIKF